jgi:hypothetical protein
MTGSEDGEFLLHFFKVKQPEKQGKKHPLQVIDWLKCPPW